MKTHRSLGLVLVVIVVACGGGPLPAATETTIDTDPPETVVDDSAFHYSPFVCQLPVVLRRNHAAAIGQIDSLDGPFIEDGSISGREGREYWTLSLTVSEVVPGSFATAVETNGSPLAPLSGPGPVTLIVNPDNGTLSFDGIKAAHEKSHELMILLQGGGDPNHPEEQGYWYVHRAIRIIDDTSVSFIGACSEELDAELAAVAEALERKPDLDFLIDFQAEVLSNYGRLEDQGPIEKTAFELVEPEPLPETTLPG